MLHNVSSKCNIEKIIFRWTFGLCDIIGSQIKSLWAKICNFYQHQEKLLWLWQDESVSFIKISSKCNVEKNHFRWPFSFSEILGTEMKWLWAKICNFHQNQEKFLWLQHDDDCAGRNFKLDSRHQDKWANICVRWLLNLQGMLFGCVVRFYNLVGTKYDILKTSKDIIFTLVEWMTLKSET